MLKVEEELARLTHSTYPVAQLLQRPLPDGVDPTRLELYVDPQHFQVNGTHSYDTSSMFVVKLVLGPVVFWS